MNAILISTGAVQAAAGVTLLIAGIVSNRTAVRVTSLTAGVLSVFSGLGTLSFGLALW